jgi:hypothetical protein
MERTLQQLLNSLGELIAENETFAQEIKKTKDPRQIKEKLDQAGLKLTEEEFEILLKGALLLKGANDNDIEKIPEDVLDEVGGGFSLEKMSRDRHINEGISALDQVLNTVLEDTDR